jgi:4-hydroxy-tetrahydrodipicolinate synthase
MTDKKTAELQTIRGVFPVLPTPFDKDFQPDEKSLRCLVRYLIASGVDGMTYPGVASEFSQLTPTEREHLSQVVIDEVAGRVPVVIGVSSSDAAITLRLARSAATAGAAALMVAAPPQWTTPNEQIAYFKELAAAVPDTALMLQNVPPPVGAGLEPEVILAIIQAVPQISYIKEESLPSGQRLTAVLAEAPKSLKGLLGGAGGRYITDELRRGACGTMPAIELAEVHVALFAAHHRGDDAKVRQIFARMLPILNIQAVFRWSLTKEVLRSRGLIAYAGQRISGPKLDALDLADVSSFMHDLDDLLLSPETLRQVIAESDKESV